MALLPVSLSSNNNTFRQTAAASIASGIAADLRNTSASVTTSPIYQLVIPAAGAAKKTQTLFFGDDASVLALGTAATATSRFCATITLTPPAAASTAPTAVRVWITWPVAVGQAAAPTVLPAGSYDSATSLDRN